jgi:hypothetical protein
MHEIARLVVTRNNKGDNIIKPIKKKTIASKKIFK